MINAQLILVRHQSSCEVGRTDEVLNEHALILEAIVDRDLEKAEQSMTTHLHNSRENVIRLFREWLVSINPKIVIGGR